MIVFWFLFIHYMHKKPNYEKIFRKENMLKGSNKCRCKSI